MVGEGDEGVGRVRVVVRVRVRLRAKEWSGGKEMEGGYTEDSV